LNWAGACWERVCTGSVVMAAAPGGVSRKIRCISLEVTNRAPTQEPREPAKGATTVLVKPVRKAGGQIEDHRHNEAQHQGLQGFAPGLDQGPGSLLLDQAIDHFRIGSELAGIEGGGQRWKTSIWRTVSTK
jgi:hypothetical protein